MRLPKELAPLLTEIRITIRHIIGFSLRRISDILLYDYEMPSKVSSKPEVEETPAPVESDPPPPKVRDRSKYDPMEHGAVPSALYGALTIILRHGREASLTVNQILEEIEATDSTLRKGLKVMEEKGVMGHKGSPAEFFITNEAMALVYLQEFKDREVPLFLKEPREANAGLH
jgi:hypothetical protein